MATAKGKYWVSLDKVLLFMLVSFCAGWVGCNNAGAQHLDVPAFIKVGQVYWWRDAPTSQGIRASEMWLEVLELGEKGWIKCRVLGKAPQGESRSVRHGSAWVNVSTVGLLIPWPPGS